DGAGGDGAKGVACAPGPGGGWIEGGTADGDREERRPHLSSGGYSPGVHRVSVDGARPQLADAYSRGRGVHANDSASTCTHRRAWLLAWFQSLRDRLRAVRVCCGDWQRVCSSRSVTTRIGQTGVFLDPPYSAEAGRDGNLYASEDLAVAHEVSAWCLEHTSDPQMRIALCGYEGEHEQLEAAGWAVVAWQAQGGYGNRGGPNVNKDRERIWFSPACVRPQTLFEQ
ncbi:MAG TPA: hypothetical protein VMZ50_08620, partial [Phycisphaerae bacterium]|nr:hypothetical protein [Phycisphaerae bacterium]